MIAEVLKRRRTYRVSGDMKQCAMWLFAAASLGLSIPRFLARAGVIYARHLAMAQLRREDKAERGWNKFRRTR